MAEDLPHVHQQIPKTWAKVRVELEKLRFRNIIPLNEFLDLCALDENGGMSKERALFCSSYLHDIGACLHYQQFPALKRFVIVRNEWATEAVYRVMDDKIVGQNHGHFTRIDLERIWKPSLEDMNSGDYFGYEDYQPELLELMHRFKLCYPLRNGEEFVAPHLLPTKKENDPSWQPDEDLQFEIEYDFMPLALFSRFVVSRYEDIAGNNRNLVWSNEVFFNWDDDAMANVSLPSRAGKKALVFKVKGGDPISRKLLLTSLLRDLKKLHSETPGIVAEERIPCICESCNKSINPTFYPYSKLKSRKENNKRTIECDNPPFREISIDDLLGNVFLNDGTYKDKEQGAEINLD
ncbi:MAG: COR domain-containing protein [Saprospiraceae bacterium]